MVNLQLSKEWVGLPRITHPVTGVLGVSTLFLAFAVTLILHCEAGQWEIATEMLERVGASFVALGGLLVLGARRGKVERGGRAKTE